MPNVIYFFCNYFHVKVYCHAASGNGQFLMDGEGVAEGIDNIKLVKFYKPLQSSPVMLAVPAGGSHIKVFKLDGVSQLPLTTFTIDNIDCNHDVEIQFEVNP